MNAIKAQQEKIIKKFMHDMHELGVDSLQMVFSALEADGTRMGRFGFGNFYARIGMMRKWLELDSAEDSAKEIAFYINENDDGID